MFDGQDPLYDIMIGLLLVGVPIILQYFYYRANRLVEARRKHELRLEDEKKQKIIAEMQEYTKKTVDEMKEQKEKVHAEMMENFRKEMHQTTQQIIKTFADDNKTTTEMLTKLDNASEKIGKLHDMLEERIDVTEETLEILKGEMVTIQNEIDDLYDKIKGGNVTKKEKRERERAKKERMNKLTSKKDSTKQ